MTELNSFQETFRRLAAPFPAEMIRQLEPNPRNDDGFRPAAIDWIDLVDRLNDVLQGLWEWEVVSYQFGPTDVTVHGRLTIYIHDIGGTLHKLSRDGTGGAFYKVNRQGQYVSLADDLKSATTDAMKRAIVLFGPGQQLYHRREAAQPRTHFDTNVDLRQQPAEPFQVDQVIQLFEQQWGFARPFWLQYLGVSDPSQINQQVVRDILAGIHPIFVEMTTGGAVPPTGQ